jgi:mannose-6-phosphate isomerase-like protein (cupin superfamily)
MAVELSLNPEFFSLKTPYLSEGRTNTLLARTDLLRLTVKVYAEGGENTLHTHTKEDHAFIVLEGEATFHDIEGNKTVVGQNQGVMLPARAYYYFQSSGTTNLVLLRVSAGTGSSPGHDSRLGPDGNSLPAFSKENNHVDGVPIPGKFFAG